MSLTNPEGQSSKIYVQTGLVLLLGVALGGGIGFYLGRATTPAPVTAPATSPGPADEPGPAEPIAQRPEPAPPGTPSNGQIAEPSVPEGDLRRLDASISGSLYATLARELQGREADILSAQIGRLLVWWLDARRDVLKGDRVQVLYQPASGPGRLRILALHYRSTKLDQTFQAYYYKASDVPYGRYFDERGREIEQRLVDSPLDEYEQVTELMNLAGRRHRGVDFKTQVGTEIRTPYRAKVIRRNWKTRSNGNCLHLVYLKSGVTALFLHLDKVLPAARPRKILKAGTVVALSGNTGRSTAPHLHYELHDRKGRLLNPFDFHKTTRRQLKSEQLEAYQRYCKRLQRDLQGSSSAGSGDRR